jgi:hypothetical protein
MLKFNPSRAATTVARAWGQRPCRPLRVQTPVTMVFSCTVHGNEEKRLPASKKPIISSIREHCSLFCVVLFFFANSYHLWLVAIQHLSWWRAILLNRTWRLVLASAVLYCLPLHYMSAIGDAQICGQNNWSPQSQKKFDRRHRAFFRLVKTHVMVLNALWLGSKFVPASSMVVSDWKI